ncbi:hypothetical protein TRFO_20681 [Tritrichomonas foetus]|uniref:AB hydrolase-1 domain-containing protein n=1 Tax=Tritrichomonas foetus TaxID=1144522 RepID=A0A1J4KFA6_9EUKA|nr:hypothetical protein TRFO_20681 [Tritrichomonas foetus]|eukprot:OHT10137.1 hypothetical protein TRFO_20681 [Tritrichomonas foetus]
MGIKLVRQMFFERQTHSNEFTIFFEHIVGIFSIDYRKSFLHFFFLIKLASMSQSAEGSNSPSDDSQKLPQLIGIENNPLVAFAHGYTGCGTNVFFPYAFTTVADLACEFVSPDFPSPANPICSEWKEVFTKRILSEWNSHQKIVLVGHSLGGYLVLRTLCDYRNEEWMKSVAGAYLVSPVADPSLFTIKWNGFDAELDWEYLRSVDIPIRLIFNPKDTELNPAHSKRAIEELEKAKNFSHIALSNPRYHPHFGGNGHFPIKEINDGIAELIKSVM